MRRRTCRRSWGRRTTSECMRVQRALVSLRLYHGAGAPLLKPAASFPPNAGQLAATEAIKEWLIAGRLLTIPDEASALTASTAWLAGAGRPYEMGADTSGNVIGAVAGQCNKDNGKLRVLLYFSAHLSQCQQNWHPFEQAFGGLLFCASRWREASRAHSGDPPNGSREYRAPEPKHIHGCSRLLYRSGTGALHVGPDAISRPPEGSDRLILARSGWTKHQATIMGLQLGIKEEPWAMKSRRWWSLFSSLRRRSSPSPFRGCSAPGSSATVQRRRSREREDHTANGERRKEPGKRGPLDNPPVLRPSSIAGTRPRAGFGRDGLFVSTSSKTAGGQG